MSDIDVRSYIDQLRRTLPYVQPIPVQDIRAMHRRGDLGGIVKLIRRTMNVNVRLTLHWTERVRGGAAAWIELPEKMPYYGTAEFAKVEAHMYISKAFAKSEPYNKFAMTVAHEFSHVVLESLHHPLRDDEKAVDLTAMILGFSYLYRRSAHVTARTGINSFSTRALGYLSESELNAACHLLLPAPMRVRHASLAFLEGITGLLILWAVLGTICFSVWAALAIRRI